MSELGSALKMMLSLLLMIVLITIPVMLFNSAKDATMQSQTNIQNVVNGLSDTSSTTSDATTSVAQESKGNKEENDKSSGGMSSFTKYLIWFIVPALLIGLLLGRRIFSYIRNSDDTQISSPWESRAEESLDQSPNRDQRSIRQQRPVSVADALENMLQTNTNAPTPSNSSSSTTNDKANAISDESDSGIRVIREDSEETSLGEREQINEPEVKRVIR
jgi:cell division protein FtsL